MYYERVFRSLEARGVRYAAAGGVKREQAKKPFVYRPSPEALRAFRNTTAEERLTWLEEANRFVAEFVPQRKREQWKKLIRS